MNESHDAPTKIEVKRWPSFRMLHQHHLIHRIRATKCAHFQEPKLCAIAVEQQFLPPISIHAMQSETGIALLRRFSCFSFVYLYRIIYTHIHTERERHRGTQPSVDYVYTCAFCRSILLFMFIVVPYRFVGCRYTQVASFNLFNFRVGSSVVCAIVS